MATTTTNFGWDIPQSTDLVKDGATAIAALGQDIDTALIDLKGGTTGQMLTKASNTDLDYTWVTPEIGDITAVTAGTGLTGGGTTGAVSLALDSTAVIAPSTLTTKGDVLVRNTTAPTRLGVGTDGQVLTADSTAATGLKWASASASSGPAFQAYSTPTQSVSSSTNTKATMTNEKFDTAGNFASSRFTPTTAGYYLLRGAISYTGAGSKTFRAMIYFNGSPYTGSNSMSIGPAIANPTVEVTNLIYFNGSTDYAELYGWSDATSPEFYLSTFEGVWIRA